MIKSRGSDVQREKYQIYRIKCVEGEIEKRKQKGRRKEISDKREKQKQRNQDDRSKSKQIKGINLYQQRGDMK